MSDLRDLYQELVLDHGRKPRNFRRIEHPSARAEGHNPLCGDRLSLYLAMDGEKIRDAAFEGSGCAISTASASLMTEAVRGKTREEAEALFERFHDLVMGEGEADEFLGKLGVFEGVRDYPTRVKCATLAWHTLRAALEARANGAPASVTTE
jgi:nitrogen fixation NifU-like protein